LYFCIIKDAVRSIAPSLAERKVGTTQSTVLPNGKGPADGGIQQVPQKITADTGVLFRWVIRLIGEAHLR